MTSKYWFWFTSCSLMFSLGIIIGCGIKSIIDTNKLAIIKDPVALYPSGQIMDISQDGTFSYRGAVGVVSHKEFLNKVGIKGGEIE